MSLARGKRTSGKTRSPPPRSEEELLGRARELAGCSLGDLARRLGERIPSESRRAKGWAGELIEAALGGSAASKSEPDFELIGVELKTIPVDSAGRPRESTYVCTVPLVDTEGLTWDSSPVRRKLARVLWVPVESDAATAPGERRIGSATLWSPTGQEEEVLRADWEELMEMVSLGAVSRIKAQHGTWLQIRPKAANARARRRGVAESGAPTPTLPRGFYLRAEFTTAILRRHYSIPTTGGVR
jgi:DNA mismatch repair protein MutH